MATHPSAEEMRKFRRPTTWLTGPQIHLVYVRSLVSQMKLTYEQATKMALARFPMSVGGMVDEVGTRGLSVTTVDIEDFASRVLDKIIDPKDLFFGSCDVDDFCEWAVANRRATHSPQQHAVADLQENESFMQAANSIQEKIDQARIESEKEANHVLD